MANLDLLGPASAPNAATVRPSESRQFGQSDTWFQPCTNQATRDGTQLQAVFQNALLAQIRYALRASGIDLSNADDGMLWKAILAAVSASTPPAKALWHSGTASGSPDAIVIADLSPAISSYIEQLPILVTMPFGNAANATLRVGTLPALSFVRNDGSPIRAHDAPAGSDTLVDIRGGAARLIGFGRAEVQQIVTNVILYVRPDGNDGNDGTYNGPGGAFQSISAALGSAIRFANTSTVVVQLGVPGAYSAPGALPKTGASFQILGDVGNPSNYNINGAGTNSIPPIVVAGSSLLLNGLQVNNTGTINNTIGANLGGSIEIRNSILTSVGGNGNYHAAAFAAGGIVIGPGTVFGSSMGGMLSANGGTIVIGGAASVVNGPNWTTGGVAAVGSGNVQLVAGGSLTGEAFGPRFYVTTNGVISTNGAGVNYFPGSTVPGQPYQSGGQYV